MTFQMIEKLQESLKATTISIDRKTMAKQRKLGILRRKYKDIRLATNRNPTPELQLELSDIQFEIILLLAED